MADSYVQLAADSTGKKIDTRTEGTNSEHRQVMVIGDPATNAGVAPVDATAGLKVDLGADNDVTVAGVATAANQNTTNTSLGNIDTSTASTATNTTNIPNVVGTAASAIPSKLLQVGGSDGTNARAIKTNTSGQVDIRPLTSSDQVTTVPSGTQTVSGTVTASNVSGDVASAATDSGNPVKVGAKYNSTQPTFTDGQRGDLQIDSRGNVRVGLYANNTSTTVDFKADNADAVATSATANKMTVSSRNTVYNGSTWDRMYGDSTGGVWQQGAIAHDGVDSGNPVKVGGKAVSAEPTAVAAADRANFITDLVGKQITLPYANPENNVSGAITSAMTGTTSTSLVAAPAAGLRNYITQITVSCAHATQGTDIIIQDGSGGTTLYTIPAAALYGGATLTFPVALRQPTTATAIYCANVTTGSSTKVSASGFKGA